MGLEVVVEMLVFTVGESLGSLGLTRFLSERKLNTLFKELDSTQKRAFLEIVGAAVMYDGKVSDHEQAWLERRRKVNDEDAALVDAALNVARDALPPGSPKEAFAAFVEKRAGFFSDPEVRERALTVTIMVLRSSEIEDRVAAGKLFGAALGVPEATVAQIDSSVSGGYVL